MSQNIMKIIAVVLPHLTFEHIKETFFDMCSSHGFPNLRNLLLQILLKRPPSSFCSHASLAERVMAPQLMCYSA